MIGTSSRRRVGRTCARPARERKEKLLESLTSGTFVGAGSFRCRSCDYTLTLVGSDTLTDCPSCGGKEFVRASLFSNTERMAHGSEETEEVLFAPAEPDRDARMATARGQIEQPGEYLCFEDSGTLRTLAL